MFCILENDLKTYEYFGRYIDCFEKQKNCTETDNRIQAEELAEHLRRNGISERDTQEKLNWVAANGKPFREYLNTIKLIYVLCRVQGIDPRGVSESQFHELENKLNDMRHCLGSIF